MISGTPARVEPIPVATPSPPLMGSGGRQRRNSKSPVRQPQESVLRNQPVVPRPARLEDQLQRLTDQVALLLEELTAVRQENAHLRTQLQALQRDRSPLTGTAGSSAEVGTPCSLSADNPQRMAVDGSALERSPRRSCPASGHALSGRPLCAGRCPWSAQGPMTDLLPQTEGRRSRAAAEVSGVSSERAVSVDVLRVGTWNVSRWCLPRLEVIRESISVDLLAVQETHLASVGLERAQTAARRSQLCLHHGRPVPTRPGTLLGKSCGVGFFAKAGAAVIPAALWGWMAALACGV